MSDQQNVYGINESNAILLLAAAQELDLDPSVVQTTTSGYFVVPKDVAEKAGFDEKGLPSEKAAKDAEKTEDQKAAELEAARTADADAIAAAADAHQADPTAPTSEPATKPATEEVDDSDAELKGDALTQALKDRGISASGLSADEKRAAVADYDSKNGS